MENHGKQKNVLAHSLIHQADVVLANEGKMRNLFSTVDYAGDLSLSQWAQWFALTLEFAPDLALEIGRGRGNSTCVFTQAANIQKGMRVESFCLSDDWQTKTQPNVAKIVEPDWFNPLKAYVADLRSVNFVEVLGEAKSVLVLWDAHGFEVADCILSKLMPLLADKRHIVVMHDITDSRYNLRPGSYKGMPFWRGQRMAFEGKTARFSLLWMDTMVDQAIAAVDFASRNAIDLISGEEDIHTYFDQDKKGLEEIRRKYPSDLFSMSCHWIYFSLNGYPPPYHFPAYLE